MKNIHFILFIAVSSFFLSCKKESTQDPEAPGVKLNTWTFTQGANVYSGVFIFEVASLTETSGSNNAYAFGMLGVETSSGFIFNIYLHLLDKNFTVKNYQSGVDGTDYNNAFYYSETVASDNTYKSSNLDPGPVMNYTVTNYDSVNDIVSMTFSGKAQLLNGNYVDITNGKLTVKIERL
jgi:uncharacterized protein YxeA